MTISNSTSSHPVQVWPQTDPLDEVLHHLQMSGVFYSRSELAGSWGVELPPLGDCLMFHVVTEGHCWLMVDGEKPHQLKAGDFALVPHGQGHRLLSSPRQPTVNLFDLPREQISERYEVLRLGHGQYDTQLICGAVRFERPAARYLIRLLPRLISINAEHSAHMEWWQAPLNLMASEASQPRPGGETIITRLADILVMQAIRSWMANHDSAQTGWLAALQDKQIGQALLCIQREPSYAWSVERLAEQVAMSRSAFAARFKKLLGISPMQYLTEWRMNIAATWLQDQNLSIAELAGRLGYQSEAAFSRTFKRVIGTSPGQLRRNR